MMTTRHLQPPHFPTTAFNTNKPLNTNSANSTANHKMAAKKLLILLLLLITFDYQKPNVIAEEDSDVDSESSESLCSSNDFSSFLPLPYGSLPNMVCKRLWNSFVIRYSQTEGDVITIVLSAIYTTGWVGIGFSKTGMMLNSSCMVGWINVEGRARIKQYYVEGFTPSKVKADRGELPLTSVPPYVALNGARIHLAFQLKYPAHLEKQPLLLAYSSAYPLHHHLTIHDDKRAILFDFHSGSSDSSPNGGNVGSYYGTEEMKKAHGVLSFMGWGLFLPIGAICARYLRHKDPLWYYVHVVIGFLGFILGVPAAIVGLSLDHKLHAQVVGHKTIGVFVLVLSILQVIAFFARPGKDSKKRGYWNWYHHWTGRIAIFLAVTNVFLGIHVAGAGSSWKIAYGILLAAGLSACIILEALSRMKRPKQPDFSPNFQMN